MKPTHGMRYTRLYQEWARMKARCKSKDFIYHQQRGISYYEEWEHFEPFMKWAIENNYRDDLELDRIDNDLGYSPNNCRWVTRFEQAANKRRNIMIEIEGERLCLAEVCRRMNLNYTTVYGRIKRGMDAYKALGIKGDAK